MEPILFIVSQHRGRTGGEFYNTKLERYLKQQTKTHIVEIHPIALSVSRTWSRLFRRFAFAPWFVETVIGILLTCRYATFKGTILQDYEICRYTWILAGVRRLVNNKTITLVFHFDDRETSDTQRLLAIRRRRIRHSDHIITISEYSRREIIRSCYPAHKITIAKPGSNKLMLSKVRDQACECQAGYLLSVANVIPHKGFDVLVAAIAQCQSRGFELIIAGSLELDPGYVEMLRKAIRTEGLENRITLTGRVTQERLYTLYQNASIFVLPSFVEGYSIAIAEALQFGLPVISTIAGAIPELVDHGKTGLLVNPGDPEGLALAIDHLLGDPKLTENFAIAARHHGASLPTWDETCKRVMCVIKSCY